MAHENCPFAYHKQGDISVHCKMQNSQQDYCVDSYYCNNSKRYEATKTKKCVLRKSE